MKSQVWLNKKEQETTSYLTFVITKPVKLWYYTHMQCYQSSAKHLSQWWQCPYQGKRKWLIEEKEKK